MEWESTFTWLICMAGKRQFEKMTAFVQFHYMISQKFFDGFIICPILDRFYKLLCILWKILFIQLEKWSSYFIVLLKIKARPVSLSSCAERFLCKTLKIYLIRMPLLFTKIIVCLCLFVCLFACLFLTFISFLTNHLQRYFLEKVTQVNLKIHKFLSIVAERSKSARRYVGCLNIKITVIFFVPCLLQYFQSWYDSMKLQLQRKICK